MHDLEDSDAEADRRRTEEGVRQIEWFVEQGDLAQAEIAFELTATGVAESADEGQLARLRKAAETIGISADGLPSVAVPPRF
ncbi:hypothetical protein NFI95_10520 [Acetobacteraceae bacterium KSS8]|uniref:Transcriptional regulator n=1 Tax=Endosaccharibacter trunci TaxID=2812733 RepID=A0ABT1W9U2_9PROT|nr:hypothetical protein [Acetobacteraceae bacterium KSS8]